MVIPSKVSLGHRPHKLSRIVIDIRCLEVWPPGLAPRGGLLRRSKCLIFWYPLKYINPEDSALIFFLVYMYVYGAGAEVYLGYCSSSTAVLASFMVT